MASFKNNPVTNYFRTTYQELSRVAWPTRQQTLNHSLMVVGLSLAFALFLGAVDYVFNYGLQLFVTKF